MFRFPKPWAPRRESICLSGGERPSGSKRVYFLALRTSHPGKPAVVFSGGQSQWECKCMGERPLEQSTGEAQKSSSRGSSSRYWLAPDTCGQGSVRKPHTHTDVRACFTSTMTKITGGVVPEAHTCAHMGAPNRNAHTLSSFMNLSQ